MWAMESTDQQILALLAREGRMSFTDIGRETGLSISAAQQRVRRLEQRGVIVGYHAEIDGAAMGRGLLAIIQIRTHGDDAPDVEGVLESMPELVSCYSVAGAASHICLAEVASPNDLDELLSRIRSRAHVTTSTTVVLRTVFRDRPPVQAELAQQATS